MQVLIHKFYKSKNGNIVIIVRDLGCFATRLITKPKKQQLSEALAIDIVKSYYEEEEYLDIKFVDDPDCMEDISITYYETCYGWDL